MKKLIVFFMIISFLSPVKIIAEDKNQSALNKYLVPAEITKLDWILLKITVSSFVQKIKWDNLGIVESITLYSNDKKPAIMMTFSINKKKYLVFKKGILEKIFTDVVNEAFGIIKEKLPEINLKKDIYANFVPAGDDSDMVAEFEDGKIHFIGQTSHPP